MTSKKKITIAYSPDTDDQFMVLALKEKKIDWQDFDFEFVVDDIQKLNQAAMSAKYDITAISVGAYPVLRKDYLMMPIGASVGDEFGPAIVTSPQSDLKISDLKGKKVAVPGLNTTAYISAQTLLGPFEPIPMYFMDIRDAVLKQNVDAGILIHELQLDPESDGLKKIGDLGKLWFDRFKLPLPLGANAIRRSLGSVDIAKLSKLYSQSIEFALASRDASIKSAIFSAAAKDSMTQELGDRYISMYVNERSLSFQDDTIRGISKLYESGISLGLFTGFNLSEHLSS